MSTNILIYKLSSHVKALYPLQRKLVDAILKHFH